MPSYANPPTIRIGLPTGEPLRLEGLRTIFEQQPAPERYTLLPVTGTLEQLVANPDLDYLVVDLNSTSDGLQVLEVLRRARPSIRQIVIGPDGADEVVLQAITAGARAYLASSAGAETLRLALDVVVSGSIWAPRRLLSKLIDRLLGVPDPNQGVSQLHLTMRERQVLELILLARSNREIALKLGIEERTVKAHVGRLMRKTGADNRIELSMRALNRQIMPIPEEEAPETED